jgi:murein DD-endopeptidase MepM/ murein hydrolase activator NlpD
MNKIYYFSKAKLQFVEIKYFKYKLTSVITISVIVISLILFGGYSYIFSLINSGRDINSLKNSNKILKTKLEEVTEQYKMLDRNLDSLINSNTDLRIAAGLPPISDEVRMLGYGGGVFDNDITIFTKDSGELQTVFKRAEDLTRKASFEKLNYEEIANKLEENQELYSSLPAVKPCEGTIGYDRFGMRMHPILHRLLMHYGIDIVAEKGTPVYASGKGKVVFTGYHGGLGLTVEIDHGFGYRSLYAHLSKVLVKRGRKVLRGDVIAKTGNTGLSTGPHLHYEIVHNGIKQDPMKFIFDGTNLFD